MEETNGSQMTFLGTTQRNDINHQSSSSNQFEPKIAKEQQPNKSTTQTSVKAESNYAVSLSKIEEHTEEGHMSNNRGLTQEPSTNYDQQIVIATHGLQSP